MSAIVCVSVYVRNGKWEQASRGISSLKSAWKYRGARFVVACSGGIHKLGVV